MKALLKIKGSVNKTDELGRIVKRNIDLKQSDSRNLEKIKLVLNDLTGQDFIIHISVIPDLFTDSIDLANRESGFYQIVNELVEEMIKNEPKLKNWSDHRLESNQTSLGLEIDSKNEITKLFSGIIFYKALNKFCLLNDRYKDCDYYFLTLFSAWQCINFCKLAILHYENLLKEGANNTENLSDWSKRAKDLFEKDLYPEIFKITSELITNKVFSSALIRLSQWLGDKQTQLPLVREKLLTSLFLVNKSSLNHEKQISINLIFKPEFVDAAHLSNPIQWQRVELTPTVRNKEGSKASVRNFVVEWLLSRYDFETAFHFARLLKKNQVATKSDLWLCNPLIIVFSFVILLLLISIPSICANIHFDNLSDLLLKNLLIGAIPGLVLFIGVLISLSIKFDSALFYHLMLPRLWGGIFVGYFAIVLEGDTPIDIVLALFGESRNWILPLIFWLVLVAVVYLYMQGEIYFRIRDKKISSVRALIIAFYSLAFSTMGSFLFLPFSTAVFSEKLGGSELFGLGPIGGFDIRLSVIFIPLALVTGVILQFMFEKQPVTAPIWEIEQD